MTRATTMPRLRHQATAASRNTVALSVFSSGRVGENARCEASSMQTWTNSRPTPWLLDCPVRSPVMRCPTRSKRPSFLMSKCDQLARTLALVAPHRRGRLQIAQPAEPQPLQDAADGGRRDAELGGDRLAGPALPAQLPDPRGHRRRRRPAQPVRPRRAVDQTRRPLRLENARPTCGRSAGRRLRHVRRPPASARPTLP